ncbi:MAG TPA: Rieske (2Fe-2S) protein [Xanthobacteraceae bacterium]|nr:Rieske (2Fe-2S) protein [Xanthobacteraceae bacterium]
MGICPQVRLRWWGAIMNEAKKISEKTKPARRCACDCLAIESSTRRGFLAVLSAFGWNLATAVVPALAEPASERPKEGDLLVAIDGEKPDALAPKDIPDGGPPVLAWPMDAADKTIRKESRLNKILLVRLDPATLVGVTKERAAEGVVAYSAICPHAGCEVNVWAAEQQILECSCHFSHYNPREAAAVIDGPATRALSALPLKIVDGKLAVAKPFTGRVGIAPS